jgi:hypothetical protein
MPRRFGAKIGPAAKFLTNLGYEADAAALSAVDTTEFTVQ